MDEETEEFVRLLPAVTNRSEALALFAIMGVESGETFTLEEYRQAASSLQGYHEATGADITAALGFLEGKKMNIEDMAYQISLDVVWEGVPDEKRKAAVEIVSLYNKGAVRVSDFEFAGAIVQSYKAYAATHPSNLFIRDEDMSLISMIYAAGRIAGIRHERKRNTA